MTALDLPVQGRSTRTARREAERAARSMTLTLRRVMAAATAGAALGLVAGVLGLVLGRTSLLLGWPVLVLAASVGWTILNAQRTPPPAQRGLQLNLLVESKLHEHLARLATEVGVQCPTEVWLVPEAEIRLVPDPDSPVLYVGAPLLWHLDLTELDRLVAGPLSRMRPVLDPQVRPGLQLSARLDVARLTNDATPLLGVLVRRAGRRLESRRQALLDAVGSWSDSSVPKALRPTPSDIAELLALREVDDIQAERREAAAARGVGLGAPGATAIATLAACERVGVIESRTHRTVVRPAFSLLVDAVSTDRRLGERAAMVDGHPVPMVSPEDLPNRVWLPQWRDERDAGLPVVVHLTGRWPRTLAELLEVLAPGTVLRRSGPETVDRVPVLGALLAGLPHCPSSLTAAAHGGDAIGESDDERHARERAEQRARLEAVTGLLTAAIQVVALEQDRLTLGWHDAWGPQLLDHSGEVVPVATFVGDSVTRRDVHALRGWLEQLGIDLDVAWHDAEPPPGGLDELPITAVTAALAGPRLTGVDLVILDGWMLGYPHPSRRFLADLAGRLLPRPSETRELLELARTHRDSLVGVADAEVSVRLADVTSARLDGSAHSPGWHLCLELPDRRLELCGHGRADAMAAALRPDLRERLVTTGTARPGLPARSWPAWWSRLATRACVVAFGVLAVAVIVGAVAAGWLPGDTDRFEAVAVLELGVVAILLCRLAEQKADRALRRAGGQPRLASF